MKKITFLIILLSNLAFSQKSFEATYKVEFNFEDKEEQNAIVKRYKNIAIRNSKKIEFTLKGNDKISEFSIKKNMVNEDKNVKITLALAGYINDGLYQDIENGLLIRNNPESSRLTARNEFLIKSPLFDDWKLIEESRTISENKCFKAKGKIDNNNEVKKYQNITAWYCPGINFNYGPLGFGNLPGLIVHLKIDETNYILKNLRFSDNKKVDFELPDKGKEITEEQFLKIFKKRMKEFQK